MQPDEITPRTLAHAELQIRVKEPVYDYNDATMAWKMVANNAKSFPQRQI